MILRKPYAFLIKQFKLIHLILAAFIVYLLYTTNLLLTFFREFVKFNPDVIGQSLTDSLFSVWVFLIPFVIGLITVVLLVVMIVKQKPYLFYIVNIVIYIAVLVIYNIIFGFITTMEKELLDIRVIRAIRDILSILIFVQIFSLVIVLIRAIGFDIRKFNFGQDLQELNISEEDNEEFEVELGLDSDVVRRRFRKRLRNAKYFYLEHKFAIWISGLFVLGLVSVVVYLNTNIYNKVVPMNTTFTAGSTLFRVDDVYMTTKDTSRNRLTKDQVLVVAKISLKSVYRIPVAFQTVNLRLEAASFVFAPTNSYRDKLSDLGITYENQNITFEGFTPYIFTFVIPKSMMKEKLQLSYDVTNSFSLKMEVKKIRVDIKVNDLDLVKKTETFAFGEEVNFKDSLFGETKLKINSSEFKNVFEETYPYCITASTCYEMLEFLKPEILGNEKKGVWKLQFEFFWNDKAVLTNNTLYDVISKFGILEYTSGGVTKTQTISWREIVPKRLKKTNTHYIEVTEDVVNADMVTLKLQIRDYVYEYRVK